MVFGSSLVNFFLTVSFICVTYFFPIPFVMYNFASNDLHFFFSFSKFELLRSKAIKVRGKVVIMQIFIENKNMTERQVMLKKKKL